MRRSLTRRRFLTSMLAGAGGATLLSACGSDDGAPPDEPLQATIIPPSSTAATSALEQTPTSTPQPTATSAPTATPQPPVETLRLYADKLGLEVGNILFNLRSAREVITKEFNSVLLTGEVSWRTMELFGRGAVGGPYSFDAELLAERHNFHFNPIDVIWWPAYPDWIKRGEFDPSEAPAIIRKRMLDVITPLKGKIKWCGVLNEFSPLAWLQKGDDPLSEILGDELADIAFQAAREADPTLPLIYTDYSNHGRNGGVENGLNYARTKEIVDRLLSQDLIDGVGLQMHVDGAHPPTYEDLVSTAKSYGVPTYITELDVNMKDVFGTKEERFAKQADVYRTITQAALDSGVCRSINFWCVGDKDSIIERDPTYPGVSTDADPTLFDDDLSFKPAYFAVRDVLKRAAENHP